MKDPVLQCLGSGGVEFLCDLRTVGTGAIQEDVSEGTLEMVVAARSELPWP